LLLEMLIDSDNDGTELRHRDNVTAYGIRWVVESWLEVQQRCRNCNSCSLTQVYVPLPFTQDPRVPLIQLTRIQNQTHSHNPPPPKIVTTKQTPGKTMSRWSGVWLVPT